MQKLLGPYLFDAANDSFDLPAFAQPVRLKLQLVGTSVQTLEFQDSLDGGTTYVAVRVYPENTGAAAANMTAAGVYVVGEVSAPSLLLAQPRLRNTAFTSGSFNAYILISTLS